MAVLPDAVDQVLSSKSARKSVNGDPLGFVSRTRSYQHASPIPVFRAGDVGFGWNGNIDTPGGVVGWFNRVILLVGLRRSHWLSFHRSCAAWLMPTASAAVRLWRRRRGTSVTCFRATKMPSADAVAARSGTKSSFTQFTCSLFGDEPGGACLHDRQVNNDPLCMFCGRLSSCHAISLAVTSTRRR